MNKTAIKNFAIWARNKLIADISYRAGLMGITADGIHAALPQSTGQTEFYDIGTAEPYAISGEAIRQRRHLVELIQRKEKDTDYKTAYKYIIEEVAYTWFNRLIAVRFMEVNDYLPSHIRVLSSDTGKLEPDLVTTPFDSELEFTNAEQQTIIDLKNANKLDEVFRMLFIKQCNALNEILPALFEKTNDYTELLLNLSVIDQDGVVYHLVHDIPEEDFDVERGGQVEIIGWLYQYYNTDPKDETFDLLKQNVKVSKERIPAATQLFTPDWIVRYMVENSLGRIWAEGHPNNDLKAGWKYYLEEAKQEPEVQAQLLEIRKEYAQLNPEDIKVIDPCMGSGHILVYAFDVLMQIYENVGYGQRDAARSILENNIYGLDIDDRAFQMAYFAVMMKARQYNRRILNGEYKPNIYSIKESNGINRNQLKFLGSGLNDFEKNNAITQIIGLLDTFKDAKEYGSILTVDQYDWNLLERFVADIETFGQLSIDAIGVDETADQVRALVMQGRVMSQQYHVIITNPPYMGSANMNPVLLAFIKKKYPDSKNDISTVLMERAFAFANKYGLVSMINIPVWMFLSRYEGFRKEILRTRTCINMVHPGRGIFGSDFGTTTFVFLNSFVSGYIGNYRRLFNEPVEVESLEVRERQFLDGKGKFYSKQDNFSKISSSQFAYWVSDKVFQMFDNTAVKDFVETRSGLGCGDNDKFLRLWFEINRNLMDIHQESGEQALNSGYKWFPYNKGGDFRKHYGNKSYVLAYDKPSYEVMCNIGNKLPSRQLYFRPMTSWTDATAYKVSLRYFSAGALFGTAGPAIFTDNYKHMINIQAYLNGRVAEHILKIVCASVHYNPGDIGIVPVSKEILENDRVFELEEENIRISQEDWDSFETSWDFQGHPLVKGNSLKKAYLIWNEDCKKRFTQLKANEEELNTIFIREYGLDGELTSDVEEKDITVNQADEQRDIKSLLSYAVGCMFGRYSLDYVGLAYAGGEWNEDKYSQFIPDADNVIPISDEEYLEDDIVSRLCTFLKVVYGGSTLEENLDYIANVLGNKGDSSREIIRNYFLNDFFKDHCQIYSVTGSGKRPIYWLFDSGKQNGFKALIYLHRYNADTIGTLRIDYLHRMQRVYESEISRMQDMIDHSTNAREVGQATKRRDKLTKQLKECREYDEKLAHLALSRIELDLDDGVKVNYRKLQTANDGKFYEVLADSKTIMAQEK